MSINYTIHVKTIETTVRHYIITLILPIHTFHEHFELLINYFITVVLQMYESRKSKIVVS